MIYKIITKVLANRMQRMLSDVISETQSAFVKDRLITDNNLVAFEIAHFLKRKMKGKMGLAALKVDMSKAYDRIECDFLLEVMCKMGFPNKWLNLIRLYISTVRYI